VLINKAKRLGGALASCVLMAKDERDMYVTAPLPTSNIALKYLC